ncbi:hypothetical protein KY305_17020 [Bacillus sp. YC2]|uniref:hypothetical protein n=1 Tax=Bacillus sp. YC2 TaxID=2861287 RepID=UPI001CA6AB95|nr:hypothetical protein [Bacillus sp. YC2]MBY8914439.1 hypothetical protein [Bacillus sp. YC2]
MGQSLLLRKITIECSFFVNCKHVAVVKAIEQEREEMFNAFELKMNDSIEKRDRLLMRSINRTMEEKRLEIAAAQEEKITWWSKLFSNSKILGCQLQQSNPCFKIPIVNSVRGITNNKI